MWSWLQFFVSTVLPVAGRELLHWLYEWQVLVAGILAILAARIWGRSVVRAARYAALSAGAEPAVAQRSAAAAVVPFGFEPENRPFKPHLTVGRVRGRQRLLALQQILLERRDFTAEPFDVMELVLYKSELRPDGARYTPLFKAPFAGRPA